MSSRPAWHRLRVSRVTQPWTDRLNKQPHGPILLLFPRYLAEDKEMKKSKRLFHSLSLSFPSLYIYERCGYTNTYIHTGARKHIHTLEKSGLTRQKNRKLTRIYWKFGAGKLSFVVDGKLDTSWTGGGDGGGQGFCYGLFFELLSKLTTLIAR